MAGYFITGTDTDSGKTLVTLSLMKALQQEGLTVNAMKPVAAGVADSCLMENEDALLLQASASTEHEYAMVNPYVFQPAIAPHIAAEQAEINIEKDVIVNAYRDLNKTVDITLVEGAGGWFVPLNQRYDIAHIPRWLKLPVILVVGLKLGCINHARLSLAAIRDSECDVVGWIGSQVDKDMNCLQENIQTLENYLDIPCLGTLPYSNTPEPESMSDYLDISRLQERSLQSG